MKTNHFFRLFSVAVLLTTVSSLSAQVTVGSDISPSRATLLELKSQQTVGTITAVTDAGNVTSTTGGFLLPRVKLVSTATLEPFITTTDPEYNAEF